MQRFNRLLLPFLVLAALLGHVGTAVAEPTKWSKVDITLHQEQGRDLLLVAGELPADVKLPYEAELAVPTGMQIQWAGEILGGDPSNDPKVSYVKTSSSDGVDIYKFILTKSRIAQIEGTVAGITSLDGQNTVSALAWTAWQDLPEVRISQRLPQSARIVQVAPDASLHNSGSGFSYYSKTVKNLKAGDPVSLNFTYAIGTTPATGGASPAMGTSKTPLLVMLLVLGGGGFFLVRSVNRKMSGNAVPADSSEPVPASTVRATSPAGKAKRSSNSSSKPKQDKPVRVAARPQVIMLSLAALVLGGFVIAGAQGASTPVVDGKASKFFGSTTACANVTYPVTPAAGINLTEKGGEVVDAFIGKQGIGDVSLDVTAGTISVRYCVSNTTEEEVRQTLASSGLVSVGQPVNTAPAPAPAGGGFGAPASGASAISTPSAQ